MKLDVTEREIKLSSINHSQGFMYCLDLPEYSHISDTLGANRSPLLLYENDVLLGSAHSPHVEIREIGLGRYSHWNNTLYFSTSDNTDPRTNGRTYKFKIVNKLDLNKSSVREVYNLFLYGLTESERIELLSSLMKHSFDYKHYYSDPLKNVKETIFCFCLEQLNGIYGGSIAIYRNFKYLMRYLKKYSIDIQGKTILEIGPGQTAGLGLLFILSGARKYTSIEAYKDSNWNNFYTIQSLLELVRTIDYELDLKLLEEVVSFENNQIKFNPNYIDEIWQDPKQQFSLDSDSIDITYSMSVMEHVEDPENYIRDMYRVIRKDGICIHGIDLMEHKGLEENATVFYPFEFLKYSKEEWTKIWEKADKRHYTNRWRMPEFINAFKKVGFEILSIETHRETLNFAHPSLKKKVILNPGITDEVYNSFDGYFKAFSKDELEPLWMNLIAQKK
jgi:SAM-dependent methyltransferase